MKGTLALSWGPSGGFYLHHHRICLGPVALTYVPGFEIDDLMAATLEVDRLRERNHQLFEAWARELNRPDRSVG